MQEVTSVFTVSITTINQVSEDKLAKFIEKDQSKILVFENDMKDILGADDVKIENVQHFIMDK